MHCYAFFRIQKNMILEDCVVSELLTWIGWKWAIMKEGNLFQTKNCSAQIRRLCLCKTEQGESFYSIVSSDRGHKTEFMGVPFPSQAFKECFYWLPLRALHVPYHSVLQEQEIWLPTLSFVGHSALSKAEIILVFTVFSVKWKEKKIKDMST